MDSPIIVSITDFRRNAGAYIDRAVPITIVKDSRIVGEFVPASKSKSSVKDDLKKLDQIAGSLHLGIHMTPDELNKDYDKMYDEMLPR